MFRNFEKIYPDAMKNIVIEEAGQRSLAFYLAMEEYVARKYDVEAFFVWRVDPTVIIGRNQDLEAEVNMEYCASHGVHIVRRKSGGGCVYADKGNIMISYISRRGDVTAVFDRYLSSLTVCLRSLGLPAEKSGRNDIMIGERKISGNAFHQLPDMSIVHGTLLYDTDMDALETAIKPPVEKLQRHGVASVRQRVRNLSDMIPKSGHEALLSVEALENYIVSHFCEDEIILDADDIKAIEQLESAYEQY